MQNRNTFYFLGFLISMLIMYIFILVRHLTLDVFNIKQIENPRIQPRETQQPNRPSAKMYSDFWKDQSGTKTSVVKYCTENAQLIRPPYPYMYSYDKHTNFLYCRNHKVSWPCYCNHTYNLKGSLFFNGRTIQGASFWTFSDRIVSVWGHTKSWWRSRYFKV